MERVYLHGVDHAGRGKSAGNIRCPCNFIYSNCITKQFLTLKIKVKVTEYNIRLGHTRWKISTSTMQKNKIRKIPNVKSAEKEW